MLLMVTCDLDCLGSVFERRVGVFQLCPVVGIWTLLPDKQPGLFHTASYPPGYWATPDVGVSVSGHEKGKARFNFQWGKWAMCIQLLLVV